MEESSTWMLLMMLFQMCVSQPASVSMSCAAVWNVPACDAAMTNCGTCGNRIDWVVTNLGKTYDEAGEQIAGEFPTECGACAPPPVPTPGLPPNTYSLVWSDEFDGNTLDLSKWEYELGTGNWGWGNDEKQTYTTNAATVSNGYLRITASMTGGTPAYESARIRTKNKGDWTYGRVEVRAKMPLGTGTWPAIWMLPTDIAYGTWPASGEIDINEHVGFEPGIIHGTLHTANGFGGNGHSGKTNQSAAINSHQFQVYTVIWTQDYIDFFVDQTRFYTYPRSAMASSDSWPFDKRFHILLNMAIGGVWGGLKGIDDSIFPVTFEVDYVRVYQSIPTTDSPVNTDIPTNTPTSVPTNVPTSVPTGIPRGTPTGVPTNVPTSIPTGVPSAPSTIVPTVVPTTVSTDVPTDTPTGVPTTTGIPTSTPTSTPTSVPSAPNTTTPTDIPTTIPTGTPTGVPTNTPTDIPTNIPTRVPTGVPSTPGTNVPTNMPTGSPSSRSTNMPTDISNAPSSSVPTGSTVIPTSMSTYQTEVPVKTTVPSTVTTLSPSFIQTEVPPSATPAPLLSSSPGSQTTSPPSSTSIPGTTPSPSENGNMLSAGEESDSTSIAVFLIIIFCSVGVVCCLGVAVFLYLRARRSSSVQFSEFLPLEEYNVDKQEVLSL